MNLTPNIYFISLIFLIVITRFVLLWLRSAYNHSNGYILVTFNRMSQGCITNQDLVCMSRTLNHRRCLPSCSNVVQPHHGRWHFLTTTMILPSIVLIVFSINLLTKVRHYIELTLQIYISQTRFVMTTKVGITCISLVITEMMIMIDTNKANQLRVPR